MLASLSDFRDTAHTLTEDTLPSQVSMVQKVVLYLKNLKLEIYH